MGFKLYQFERIYSWIDPYSYSSNEGRHLITSLNAIGSGEIFGKGYKGREVYVAESHTDLFSQRLGKIGDSSARAWSFACTFSSFII